MQIVIPETFGSKPVAPGAYGATITNVEFKKTKDGTKDMALVELTLTTQGPDPTEKTIGRKVFENPVITEETLFRINNLLKAATGQELNQIFTVGQPVTAEEIFMRVHNEILGRNVVVIVTQETYEGVTRNKVKEVKQVTL